MLAESHSANARLLAAPGRSIHTTLRCPMKKLIGIVFSAAILIGTVSVAQRMEALGSPPGIAAENWIAIGDAAGFVVTAGDFQGSARATGSLQGYFMVRRARVWFRVATSMQ